MKSENGHWKINLMREELWLLPQKAIFLPERSKLLISDVHLGKVGHFRRNGIPIPGPAAHGSLETLHSLISALRPEEVIFLGDLFHSDANREWLLAEEFFAKQEAVQFSLVPGNHDFLEKKEYSALGLQVLEPVTDLGSLRLQHHPTEEENEEKYVLCGHLHPGLRMRGAGKQRLKLPCFWLGKSCGVLPAFGNLTGLFPVEPQPGDQVFVIADETVIQVSGGAVR